MFTIIFFLVFIVVLTYAIGGYSAAPWVPCRTYDAQRFCDLAHIGPNDTVIELGCGDARIIAAAATLGATCTGYEISLLPYLLAKARTFFSKPRPRILFKNFWSADISSATVVAFFLLPAAYERLSKKLLTELKPGTRIICYVWPLPPDKWTPILKDKPTKGLALYVYEIPNRLG